MKPLVVDPSKPIVAPRPEFMAFRAVAFRVPIGSDLDENTAISAKRIYDVAVRHAEVLFEIDSDGGLVEYLGVIVEVIYDLIESGVDVRALVYDKCYSAAMTLLMIFPAAARYCQPQSKFMIHSAHFGPGSPKLTPEGQMYVAEQNRLYILDPIVASTRITRRSLQAALNTGSDLFISAPEALELGIVSAIIK